MLLLGGLAVLGAGPACVPQDLSTCTSAHAPHPPSGQLPGCMHAPPPYPPADFFGYGISKMDAGTTPFGAPARVIDLGWVFARRSSSSTLWTGPGMESPGC